MVWVPEERRMRLLGRVAGIAGQQHGGGGGHGGADAILRSHAVRHGEEDREKEMEKKD
jgi:hypothetical protein